MGKYYCIVGNIDCNREPTGGSYLRFLSQHFSIGELQSKLQCPLNANYHALFCASRHQGVPLHTIHLISGAFLPCDIRKIGTRILPNYQSSQLPTPRLNQNGRDLLQLPKAVFYLGMKGAFFSFAVADIFSVS